MKVFIKYYGKCALCGRSLTYEEMTVDHLVPKCLGGEDLLDNLMPTCSDCNSFKGGKTLEEFKDELNRVASTSEIGRSLVNATIGRGARWNGKFYFEREKPFVISY